ncbi:MAG: LysM domain-containing protein [Gammaproteobacteria bacterium]
MRILSQGVLWLLCFVISTAGYSGNREDFVDNPPQTYTVKSGDTLSEISERFLKDPWRWREIWRASPGIQNPDLIYPGDIITLKQVDGQTYISVERSNQFVDATENVMSNGIVKLSPRIRSEPAKKPIPTLPIDVIGPFLNNSQVVSSAAFNSAPRIVALEEDHLAVGEGSRIYVAGLPENDIKGFTLFRKGKIYKHPYTNEVLGVEAEVLGAARFVDRNRTLATLNITNSVLEVLIGDRVMPLREEELTAFFTPKLPKQMARGYIISVFGGLNQIGQYQVIAITGGKNIEREPGDVLFVYQTQQDIQKRFENEKKPRLNIPADYVGQVMVFRVFDKVSFALVTKAFRAIYLLDEVASP